MQRGRKDLEQGGECTAGTCGGSRVWAAFLSTEALGCEHSLRSRRESGCAKWAESAEEEQKMSQSQQKVRSMLRS